MTTEFFSLSKEKDRCGLRSVCIKCRRKKETEYRNNRTIEQIEHRRKYKREYERNLRQNDATARLISNARCYQWYHLTNKTEHALDNVGLSGAEWMEYLSTMFLPGMTPENYGDVWEVDHIIPLSFGVDDEHRCQLFHYLNTQPMFVIPNKEKGDKFILPEYFTTLS